ncbi:hypothetical protein KBX73_04740 [Acetobacter persici]|uniref:hypothetical protein n=1 Tax=Acetobacter persici TaxID=1076596 RepID=UPI0020CC878E|nr:hypothetical protein [Acetobacter persici]MCP9319095.1 hypothetical protein [Acetobacter persici]
MNNIKNEKDMNPDEWIALKRKTHGYSETKYKDQDFWAEMTAAAEENHVDLSNIAEKNDIWRDEKIIEVVKSIMILNEEQSLALKSVNIYIYPTPDIRARVATTPKGDKLILLHSGLIHTIFQISQLIALMENPKLYSEYMNKEGVLTALCADIGRSFSDDIKKIKFDHKLTVIPLNRDQYNTAATIAYGCIIFIIAHEIGHLVHNHLGYTNNEKLNHKAEFEADEIACDIFYQYCKTSILTLTKPQVDSLFCVPFMAIGIINMLSTSTVGHPSPKTRLEKILLNLKRKINFENKSKKNMILKFEINLLYLDFSAKALKLKGAFIYKLLTQMGKYMDEMHEKSPYIC